jgi:putative hydrolase of the HAD superfamily
MGLHPSVKHPLSKDPVPRIVLPDSLVRMPNNPKVLLFDLGGVLIEFTGFHGLLPLLAQPPSPSELIARWDSYDPFESFQRGRLTPQEFAEAFCRDWSLNIAANDFIVHFRSWTHRMYPGAAALMAQLGRRFRLAALSNSNALHWERNCIDLGVDRLFERAFSSHLVGWCKPEPEIYEHALRELNIRPDEAMFFDDVRVNVDAAHGLGIAGHHVVGISELRACLSELGMLAVPGSIH